MNKVIAVIGAQYGDEGKGKIVDYLAGDADYVMRFNGSGNAGHCVETEKGERFKVHLIPAGVYRQGVICGTTAGMLINPTTLVDEIRGIRLTVPDPMFLIDPRAQVVTPYHINCDKTSEARLAINGKQIGTTGTGNGPAYADKVTRKGLRLSELALSVQRIADRLRQSESFDAGLIDPVSLAQKLQDEGRFLQRFFQDGSEVLNQAIDDGKNVIFAGAHGTFLDIDHGDYPFVTSSSCAVGGVGASGVSPTRLTEVIGCVKAYTTRSGKGPMPDMNENISAIISEKAHEFGTTTGRKRRIGWIDLDMVRKASMLNHFTSIAITMLDILSEFERIEIYSHERCAYTALHGWQESIQHIRDFAALPHKAQKFIELIEISAGVPAGLISVGPRRDQIIDRRILCPKINK